MACLFGLFTVLFPRLATVFIWLARPTLFSAAFNSFWLVPILGVIFLPFTTLMYVLLWSSGVGLAGFDWFWLILAVFLDVGYSATMAIANRSQIHEYGPTAV